MAWHENEFIDTRKRAATQLFFLALRVSKPRTSKPQNCEERLKQPICLRVLMKKITMILSHIKLATSSIYF